jgi:uncharacterized protein (TIGR02246 family)
MDDIEAIKQLKARYMRTVDLKDWEGFRNVFTDDAVWDTTSAGAEVISGADAIAEYNQRGLGDVLCIHHSHTPEIEVTSPTTATGIWPTEYMHRWPTGKELHGYGFYYESYEKVAGDWRIKTCVYQQLRADWSDPRVLMVRD